MKYQLNFEPLVGQKLKLFEMYMKIQRVRNKITVLKKNKVGANDLNRYFITNKYIKDAHTSH